MNAPRENDPSELDRFKRDIDLVDYAQRQGYTIKKESRRGDWHHLVKDDEHVIVTRKGDHQVYLNTGDDRDAGSIIDFAKTRGGNGHGLNLGQVRQQLREYLDGAPAPARVYATPPDTERLNSLPTGDPEQARQAEEERRTRLISEVLGVKKELTDRSYLHGRAITDETLDNPAFQGRIFTAQQNEHRNTAFPLYNEHGLASVEQKNEHYKSLLPLPKNGIWVSHPTDGKDTPVERVVVSESAIDSLSHFQLKHGQEPKNTLYIATSGTPTEAQVALIQRVIDKQQPREVVLANDRDAGGRQFNINYLNELQPARPMVPVAEQEAYREASRPVEWHATSDKYHTSLKVTFHHDSAGQGAGQVQQLRERVEQINQTQQDGPTLSVEVQRSTEQATIVRLTVARADTAQLEVVAQELYRQREQLRPEAERQQESFLRVDYPLAKDFNKELEYTSRGLSAEQIRAEAQREEQQRESERQQRLAEAQRQEREQRALERQAQRERESTAAGQQERAQDDKRFTQTVLEAAASDAPTRSYRSEQEAREQTAAFTHLREAGVVLLRDWMHDNPPPTGRRAREEELTAQPQPREATVSATPAPVTTGEDRVATWRVDELLPHTTGRAEAWQAVLESDGYIRTSSIRSSVDEQGIRRAEFDMYYRNEQPEIALIHAIVTNTNARAAAGNEKYVGVSVTESEQDRVERQQAAAGAALQPRTGPTREQAAGEAAQTGPGDGAGVERQVLIRVDEVAPPDGARGQAEAVKETLVASGAKAGEVQSTTDGQGMRHSEIKVSYRTDQPDMAQVSRALDAVAAQPGSEVVEHASHRVERQESARGQQSLEAGSNRAELTR
ncbi:toprim domain-containing protein [Hymenobacter latericus]|uniref:toprim domain-containing protein n=1 Tax=Hymenobacter sp. YIM 151858-1 TaxID=2987688 RepID=UPI0022271E81|nr:toprim domain-containing protein [Hymenobacter sp. YIM 151858-1]UYZ61276.1 toprim domain-containing protein [Hymenobacter sp. YIM 151858-1]